MGMLGDLSMGFGVVGHLLCILEKPSDGVDTIGSAVGVAVHDQLIVCVARDTSV